MSYIILAISGIVGISYCDLYWMKSLVAVGPRVTLLFELITPVFTSIVSFIVFRYEQTFLQWIGIFLCIIGVYIAINKN